MRYDKLEVDLTGALQAAQAISDIPKKVTQAQARALGTLRRRIATEAKRDIGQEYNLKAGRIAQGIRVRNVADGVAVIGSARGINAIQFGAKWSRSGRGSGARYRFKRGDAARAHPGTFIATGINGAQLVFMRDPKRGKHRVLRGRNAGKYKQYLLGVYGPSVGQMLKHGGRPERLAQFGIDIVGKEIDRQLGRANRGNPA